MKTSAMVFRQLFEPVSSTYTYLLGCPETGEAVLIDPVMPAWQRDLAAIKEQGLRLVMTLDTHIHADHISSASLLRREVGSRIAMPALDALPCTDVGIEDGVERREDYAVSASLPDLAGGVMNRSMKPVLSRPATKSCSAMIRRCSGTEVLMPSITVISSVRRMRAIASWRSRPWTMIFAIIES